MIKSSKPRKQRKYRAQAPLHKRKDMMKVHISKELKEKLGTTKRTLLIRKGDKVRIMVGLNKGKECDVTQVNYNKLKIAMAGITVSNSKGDEKTLWTDPSNVEIIQAKIDDDRKKILERSSKIKG